jgi:tRNA(fMet)-specific endonuclease VapC
VLVLDTDHLTELGYRSEAGRRLEGRLAQSKLPAVIPIISVQERFTGMLARINQIQPKSITELVRAYESLADLSDFLNGFTRLPFDKEAASLFMKLRKQGVRIGTMDLRIACIVMEHDAVLLTRNTVDFERVRGLKFENWLE